MDLSAVMRAVARDLDTAWTTLVSEIRHSQSAGEARENALRTLLARYLPKRAQVDTGFAIDSSGAVSNQMDILVADSYNSCVFEIEGVRHFPVETLIAAGEVKTDITSQNSLRDCIGKIASVKRLDRSAGGVAEPITGPGMSTPEIAKYDPMRNNRDQVLGFIFTASTMRGETLRNAFLGEVAALERRLRPDLLCAWRDFILSWCTEDGLTTSAMDAACLYQTRESERSDLLLLFMCQVASFVNACHVARPSLFAYGGVETTDADHYPIGSM